MDPRERRRLARGFGGRDGTQDSTEQEKSAYENGQSQLPVEHHSHREHLFSSAAPLLYRNYRPRTRLVNHSSASCWHWDMCRRTSCSRASSFPFAASFATTSRGIGSPNTTRQALGRGNKLPRGMAAPVPATPTGMTGTSARRNSTIKPGLRGPIFPLLLRVPSGKMATRKPRLRRSAPSRRLDELGAWRLTGITYVFLKIQPMNGTRNRESRAR